MTTESLFEQPATPEQYDAARDLLRDAVERQGLTFEHTVRTFEFTGMISFLAQQGHLGVAKELPVRAVTAELAGIVAHEISQRIERRKRAEAGLGR